MKSDINSAQQHFFLGPPQVAKGWDCGCIGDGPQLHKIIKVNHSGDSVQSISDGDIISIQSMWKNLQQRYNILYSSDKGWIYYDQRTPQENKQLWKVHKTNEGEISIENVKFPGRFLGFCQDGSKWATCKESEGKVVWRVLVHSRDKSGIVVRLAIDPKDIAVLTKTSTELIKSERAIKGCGENKSWNGIR